LSALKSYMRWHFYAFDKLFIAILFRIGERQFRSNNSVSILRCKVFALLFNLRSSLLKRKVRVLFDSNAKMFIAFEGDKTRRFRDIRQNFYIYQYGIAKRAENFAKEYLLDQIQFTTSTPLVIDCGANIGDLKLSLEYLGLEPRYIAFEPAPDEFACLRANAPAEETYNAGLWNSTTEIDFYVSTANADSSIIKPESYTQSIRISASRLDEVKIQGSTIDLIKLEAEGAEYEVVQGAEGLLAKTRYISADLGFERGGESTLAEVANFLTERDFKIVSFGYPRIVLLFKNKKLD